MTDPKGTATSPIDAVLAGLPDEQRSALQSLREAIAAAAPDAVEAMSYGAPAFRYRDHPLVSFNAAKSGFDTSKGTIRFTSAKPLPAGLVQTLVRARIAEIDERWG